MSTIINILLEISITSSILIIVVLIIRSLFRNRISAPIQYSMWLLVVFRLLMPFSIPSPASVMNIVDKMQVTSTQIAGTDLINNPAEKTGIDFNNAVNKNFSVDYNAFQPDIQADDTTISYTAFIILFWLIGIICTAGYMAFVNMTYFKSIHKNSFAFPNDKVYLAEKIRTELKINKHIPVIINDTISSPCLIAWFKPKIVVTSQILESDKIICHVLLHEFCHYKQRDNWFALLRNMCCAVYWFHPLVWIAAAVSRDDAEFACDEKVLQHLDDNENTCYGETLLKIMHRSKLRANAVNTSTTMSMGGKKMSKRIHQIIKRPKTLKIAAICAALILLAVSGTTLSGAISTKTGETLNNTMAEGYADLGKIAGYGTIYIGDAASVGNLIASLPEPSVFHSQNMFSLQTESAPYGLTVYYENNGYIGESVPFWYSIMDNNALILFTFIDNLDHITFAYRDTPSNGELKEEEYNGIHEFSRSDFIQRFGDFAVLKKDLEMFDTVLSENLKIDPYRIHYNRIDFGSTYEHVIYRNGDPDKIMRYEDNTYAMVYENLGEIRRYSNDDELVETIHGSNVTVYLDNNETQGVYAVYIKGNSEITADSLGIENDLTYSGITKKLGQPQITENNDTVISYQLYNSDNQYVTFFFDEFGNLESHGYHIGNNAPYNKEPLAVNEYETSEDSSEETTDIVQEVTRPLHPHDIVLKETVEIMESYSIGNIQAVVGYDKDNNIFMNFSPHDEDKRIPVTGSDESQIEWLMYPVDGSEEDKTNLDLFAFSDSITGKDYYFLGLFFAGAPSDANYFYLFDAEQEILMDYTTLSYVLITETGVNATLIKNGDEYNITIPDYGIEMDLEFLPIFEHELKEFRGETEWDAFSMDTIIHVGSIDTFEIKDYMFITKRPVYAVDSSWTPPMYIEIVYEIQNGVITPVEYIGIPGGVYQ